MEFPKVMLAMDAAELYARRLEPPYPMYASPKFDGIRCHIESDGEGGAVPLTRTNRPIPNRYINRMLSNPVLRGLDTEIIVGDPADPDVFQKTQSGVMSYDGEPEFTVYVHDLVRPGVTFEERLSALDFLRDNLHRLKLNGYELNNVHVVKHVLVRDDEEMRYEEMMCLQRGFEGLILRNPSALYKHGRAGLRGCELLKVKRFADAEARVVGCEAMLHNDNPEAFDALGYMHRSTAKEFMRAMNSLGALIVEDPETGVRFSIGSGFTAEQRARLWQERETLTGRMVTYKYFEKGVKDAPRFPVFKGFRDKADMEESHG